MNGTNMKCLLYILIGAIITVDCYTPVVMWHGAVESHSSSAHLQEGLRESLPGIYVISLQIGATEANEIVNSVILHPNIQVEMACAIIKNDPLLVDGFNAIGLSQGSQFMRGLIQRCPEANVKNFITIGGQHQGIYGFPFCEVVASHEYCDEIRTTLNTYAYTNSYQEGWTPMSFWHNPLNETDYQQHSTFLADINNELVINQDYIDRLLSLELFVLVKFEGDDVVMPRDTEWFGYYKPGQSEEVETLEESKLYKEDRLGLKILNENSKLLFIGKPGPHGAVEWEWFNEVIVQPFLIN